MAKKRVYIIIAVIFVLAFLAGNLDYPQFLALPYLPDIPFKLGLDLQGGTHLIYEADLSNVEKKEYNAAMQGLRDVIERRVNLFGVREPMVQTQERAGHHRLVVELAGVIDPAEAIKMIGQTPFLEFKEQKENYQEIVEKNQRAIESAKESGQEEVQLEDPFQSTPLTGQYLKKAELGFDQTTYQALVSLQFNDEGATIFEELTARNLGKPLAIYIDGVVISAPTVQERIAGGNAQITGRFTVEEARALARNLNAGALPIPIKLISQQSVGPTLGAISLEKSLKAGVIGFLAVVLFLIIFYRFPGFLASLALVIYIALVLAIFKIVSVTLTLAGIAGFLLSIGMAVDANILIFSRMREEMKANKNFLVSIEEGFRRAWSSIRDSNFNTLIISSIFFAFGTSFIKGFAFTLILGVLLSMFSAIFVTHNFLRVFVGTKLEKVKFLWH